MTASTHAAELVDGRDPIVVDVWSDIICPWCWIGLTRLEKAIAESGEDVTIRHHAFRLMPGTSPQASLDLLILRIGSRAAALKTMAHVEAAAAEEGLTYHLAQGRVGDTLNAHRLVKFAAAQGRERAVLQRLYRAAMTENRSVFDHDSLLDLGTETGLDRQMMQTALEGHAYVPQVEADERMVRSLGGNGVPLFRIGRQTVSGAQPTEIMLRAIRLEADSRPPTVPDGSTCGPNGCAA